MMSDSPVKGLGVSSLNCRRSLEVLLSVLNSTDPSAWDVLCLQELPAHIATLASFRSPHWTLLLPARLGSAADNAAICSVIYISNRLPSDSYTHIPLMSCDLCAVLFSFSSLSLTVIFVYNPPESTISIPSLHTALSNPRVASSPFLVRGDFNLHPLWSGLHVVQRTRHSNAEPLLRALADHHCCLPSQKAYGPSTPRHIVRGPY